jgi:hypothetical protein
MTAKQAVASPNGISKNAACTSFCAAATSLALILLLHVLAPQYDPSWRFISEYANGPLGWLMFVAFEAMALSFAALAFALKDEARTVLAKAGLIFISLSALGCAVAGIFPMDPIAPAPQVQTTNGNIHAIASMLGIPTLPIGAMLLTYGVTNGADWHPSRARLRLVANLSWISLVAMFVLMSVWMSASGGQFSPDTPIGWLNRLVVLAYLTWTMLTAAAAAAIAQGLGSADTEAARQ